MFHWSRGPRYTKTDFFHLTRFHRLVWTDILDLDIHNTTQTRSTDNINDIDNINTNHATEKKMRWIGHTLRKPANNITSHFRLESSSEVSPRETQGHMAQSVLRAVKAIGQSWAQVKVMAPNSVVVKACWGSLLGELQELSHKHKPSMASALEILLNILPLLIYIRYRQRQWQSVINNMGKH